MKKAMSKLSEFAMKIHYMNLRNINIKVKNKTQLYEMFFSFPQKIVTYKRIL